MILLALAACAPQPADRWPAVRDACALESAPSPWAVDAPSPFTYCLLAQPEDSEATCADGIDNDRDGTTDCTDWECWNGFPALCVI